MTQRRKRLAWLILLWVCSFAPLAHAASKAELADVRQRMKTLQKAIDSAKVSRRQVLDSLKHSEQAISDINRTLYGLSHQQRQINTTLRKLQSHTREIEKNMAGQQKRLVQLLDQMYLHGGRHDPLRILLDREDPETITRRLRYYRDLSQARTDLIDRLRRNLRKMQTLQQQAQGQKTRLTNNLQVQKQQRHALNHNKRTRKRVLAQLSKKIESQQEEMTRLRRDEKRLTRLLKRLARRARHRIQRVPRRGGIPREPDYSASTFQRFKGKLKFPVRGKIVGRYGARRKDTGVPWKGLFIKAPEGAPVKAVARGRVVFANWLRGFGNLLIINHGGGFMSLYGDNETLYKRVGDKVRAGETIAAVGNTGGNPESGLYFELRYLSKPVNPTRWLKGG
ncbi:MAG TPA: peptidase M23 [Betaproteobacteria bacterium]|nr:peptidase M23 [Betaproteobacteria bacterium]